MILGTRPGPNDGLRLLLAHSVRFGAMSLSEAAMTEAAVATSCGGPGFALRLAGMRKVPQVGIVRSSAPGRRGALMHAFVILDDTSGHQADWLVGDVHGILTFGAAARRWSRAEGRLLVDRTPDDVRVGPGEALTIAVARRLPWLSGLAGVGGGEPAAYAVADLARIGRIIQRCPEASVEARLKEFDPPADPDGPAAEDAAARNHGIASSMTPASARFRAEHHGVRRTSAVFESAPEDDLRRGVRP